jgi:hypothetical protein
MSLNVKIPASWPIRVSQQRAALRLRSAITIQLARILITWTDCGLRLS